jgi:hypothetical protein
MRYQQRCISVLMLSAAMVFLLNCGPNKTPDISEFANVPALMFDLPCPAPTVESYIRAYIREHNLSVKTESSNDETFIVTSYADERRVASRQRYAAYLVKISSNQQTSSQVSLKWLVTSKGDNERTMRPTDADSQHIPQYIDEIKQRFGMLSSSGCR